MKPPREWRNPPEDWRLRRAQWEAKQRREREPLTPLQDLVIVGIGVMALLWIARLLEAMGG